MEKISIDELAAEFHKFGTDERVTRALLRFAERINETLDARSKQIEDMIEEKIQYYRDQDAYHEMMKGSQ